MNDGNWPHGYVTRAIPPPGDYERPTMRAYANKARPHVVNPRRPTHTLCGKPIEWWVMHAVRVEDFGALEFGKHGCAVCASALPRLGLPLGPEEAKG